MSFREKDVLNCVKFISLVALQIAVLVSLILNWCNASAITLISYIAFFVLVSVSGIERYIHIGDKLITFCFLGVPCISAIAGCLMVLNTQCYAPATKQIESHKLASYQIKNTFDYGGWQHKLSYKHTIVFISEDSYSGEINFDDEDEKLVVHYCIDPENPRIEEITYTQEYIEHVVTGGTISFGSEETLKEIVFYLPNTDFLTPPPALPDESSK